jgi:hypothetical protein
MSWLITGTQKTINGTLTLGQAFGGGYFAGYISHTADGNPTHALIVAPRATGATTGLAWKTTNTTTANTTSSFDGAANTAAMVTAGIADHPAANFCVGLSIGGFTDWYLPARYELDIAYFNLKPTTEANSANQGINIYAIPQRNANWTSAYPAQTPLTAFNTTAEAFVAGPIRASTASDAAYTYVLVFTSGSSFQFAGKTDDASYGYVRAFRRIAL